MGTMVNLRLLDTIARKERAQCKDVSNAFFFILLTQPWLSRGLAWVSDFANKANDMHPLMECSNVGICDRRLGQCFDLYAKLSSV